LQENVHLFSHIDPFWFASPPGFFLPMTEEDSGGLKLFIENPMRS